ncbi:MAG: glycosyltransferase [Burkholderiaceae bacterium]|nr:glycosyltransferase [Burkholderiaceae bacterium]
MSIQITRSNKLIHRIQAKLRLDKAYDFLSQKYQKYQRQRSHRTLSSQRALTVYYHLQSLNTHPYIAERMYGECAPLAWSNYPEADVAHFLQKPEGVAKPYFIEPNDQILTPGVYFGASKPFEIIKRLDDIKSLIASNNFKGLLIGEDGLEDQFVHYFGTELIHKLYKYPQMRCIPRIKINEIKCHADQNGRNFLFLASDYKLKAIDLLIESWLTIRRLNGAILTIACSNIPAKELDKLRSVKSIKIIKEAPLSAKTKKALLSNADISICLTHVDGGANAWEGIEYGHPIITNTYHRSDYLTKNQNGIVIDFPNQFYRLGEYGFRFNSIEEYMANVESEMVQGRYDHAKVSLAEKIQAYIDSPELVYEHSVKSLQLAYEQSVAKSNERLLEIYREGIVKP